MLDYSCWPRACLLRGGGGLHYVRTTLMFERSIAMRKALKEHDHDLRLFTRRSRLAGLLFYLTYACCGPSVLIVSNVTPRKS